jgi:hypothetical protein
MTARSAGGNAKAGSRLGTHLLTKQFSLDVIDFCLTSCAEFLLPAADNIKFIDSPLIGFNRSPAMDYSRYVKSGTDMPTCNLISVENQRKLIEARNLNADFWKETEARLILYRFIVGDTPKNCHVTVRKFENQIWLPNSQQLRDLWGLEFEGSVCADDFEQCKKKIDNHWLKGTRIVVTDEVYTSKGSQTMDKNLP